MCFCNLSDCFVAEHGSRIPLPPSDFRGKVNAKASRQHCCEAQITLLKSSIYFTPIYTNAAVGGIPYFFLKAVEKWEGFLNPTSA